MEQVEKFDWQDECIDVVWPLLLKEGLQDGYLPEQVILFDQEQQIVDRQLAKIDGPELSDQTLCEGIHYNYSGKNGVSWFAVVRIGTEELPHRLLIGKGEGNQLDVVFSSLQETDIFVVPYNIAFFENRLIRVDTSQVGAAE